jgi:hypothetical protein
MQQFAYCASEQQKQDVSNPIHSELDIFCEILAPMKPGVRTEFYCYMVARSLRTDILICQENSVLGKYILEKWHSLYLIEVQSLFYAHFRANEMPFSLTSFTIIFSLLVFRIFKFDIRPVFLRMWYLDFLNIPRECKYFEVIWKYQVRLQWDWIF